MCRLKDWVLYIRFSTSFKTIKQQEIIIYAFFYKQLLYKQGSTQQGKKLSNECNRKHNLKSKRRLLR